MVSVNNIWLLIEIVDITRQYYGVCEAVKEEKSPSMQTSIFIVAVLKPRLF